LLVGVTDKLIKNRMSQFETDKLAESRPVQEARPLDKPNEVLRIMVPQGSPPGSDLNVRTEDGRNFMIVVPPNVNPGDTFCLEVHNDAEGGAMVTVAEDLHVARTDGQQSSKTALGAAAVGAVVGFMVIGPVTAVVAGGAALYATTRGDKVGEVARSTGGAAVTAYSSAKHVAEKYHVNEKISAATKSTVEAAKRIDNDYHVVDTVKSATNEVVKSTREINEKYDITGKTKRASASLASSLMSKMNQLNDSSSATSSNR